MKKIDFENKLNSLDRELNPIEEDFLYWVQMACGFVIALFVGVYIGQLVRSWFDGISHNELIALLLLVAAGLTALAAFLVMILKTFSGVIENE